MDYEGIVQRDLPTGIMDDILDNTADVTILLGEIEAPKTGWAFVVVSVGLKDPTGLSLGSDDSLDKGYQLVAHSKGV